MRGEDQEVKKAAQAVGGKLNQEVLKFGEKIIESIFKDGVVPKEALGFTNEKMDAVYGQAYRLYNTGKYVEALHLFRLLVVLDATESKYALGMAACFHMMKEYKNAVQTYIISALMDARNPVQHFHASDCYLQMRDKASALMCLEMAVLRAGDQPQYQMLKDRALLTIESLKKDLLPKQ